MLGTDSCREQVQSRPPQERDSGKHVFHAVCVSGGRASACRVGGGLRTPSRLLSFSASWPACLGRLLRHPHVLLPSHPISGAAREGILLGTEAHAATPRETAERQ